jgi:hypothetical protein
MLAQIEAESRAANERMRKWTTRSTGITAASSA